MNPKIQKVIEEDKRYISNSLVRPVPLVIKKGYGIYLEDILGERYIDFLSGAVTVNTGHNHPEVLRAVKEEIDNIVHPATLYLYNKPVVELAKKLEEVTPGKFNKRTFFGLSGSDAIDCALKIVRWHTKKQRVISYSGSYHGMTYGALSISGSIKNLKNFMPLIPGVTHVPYPYCFRCPFRLEYPDCDLYCLDFIEEQIFDKFCPPSEVSALFIEPIQGHSGVIVPPNEYLRKIKRLCEKYGILFVADEIQTGFGRTGKFFACEHYEIEPDIIVLGKPLASGFPLSAVVAREDIMDWTAGAHVISFGGSTFACVGAIKTIGIIRKEKLVENSKKIGNYMMKRFNELKEKYELIGDVRGKGLMIGIELVKKDGTPAIEKAHKICYRSFELGLLIMYVGKSTLRIVPPLILTENDADKAIEIIDNAIADVVSGKVSDKVLKK